MRICSTQQQNKKYSLSTFSIIRLKQIKVKTQQECIKRDELFIRPSKKTKKNLRKNQSPPRLNNVSKAQTKVCGYQKTIQNATAQIAKTLIVTALVRMKCK